MHKLLKIVAMCAAGFYVGWNIAFFVQGKLPLSIFKGLTGLPCPTTGGTRSFRALLNGSLGDSLYFNPMTVPIILLLLATVVAAVIAYTQQKRVAISAHFLTAWAFVLAVAWMLKLTSDPSTW